MNERKENYSLFLSLSCLLSFSSSSLDAFLNSLIPPPRPFISSGIFLPPKRRSNARAMITQEPTLGIPKRKRMKDILKLFLHSKYTKTHRSVDWFHRLMSYFHQDVSDTNCAPSTYWYLFKARKIVNPISSELRQRSCQQTIQLWFVFVENRISGKWIKSQE